MADRQTIQLLEVLMTLKRSKMHPTAEMVYEQVKKELPTISLATVYRNLNKLAEQGKAIKLEINGEFRYDGCIGLHQHCVCRKCGKIQDYFDEKISKNTMKNLHLMNFKPESVQIIYYGYCEDCKSRE